MKPKKKKFKHENPANEFMKKLNPSLFNLYETKDLNKNDVQVKEDAQSIDELIDKVEATVQMRHAFSYTFQDLFYQVLWFKPCKKLRKSFLYSRQEAEKYYDRGIDRYHEEFDCIEIIQSLRQLKTLVKVIMDDHHQILQNFSKEGLLDISPKPLDFSEIEVKYKNFQNRGMVSDKIAQLHAEKEKALATIRLYRENGYSIEDEKIMNQII